MYIIIGSTFGAHPLFEASDPPILTDLDPANAATNISISTTVKLSIIDYDSSVALNTVTLTVAGIIAWQNDAPQNGFTGSRSSVLYGYRYTLIPPTSFTYSTAIPVLVYAEDLLSNTLNTSYYFTTELVPVIPKLKNIQVVASDLIKVSFTGNIVNLPSLTTIPNYSLTGVNTPDPIIKKVSSYSDRLISFFFIYAQGLLYGKNYLFSFLDNTLFSSQGHTLDAESIEFLMHRTKTDDVLLTLPKFYNKQVLSSMRALVEAITISDETIGGDF